MRKAGEIVYDRLYGQIRLPKELVRLSQTEVVSRLSQISLSAIPAWTIPTSYPASRLEHSIGAAHLAHQVTRREEFRDLEQILPIAMLVHDSGSPPFSHASEYYLEKQTGKDHEVFAEEVLEGSDFAKEAKRMGVDVEEVIGIITGDDTVAGQLAHGEMDLDNLDNTLRYGISTGIMRRQIYSPVRLSEALTISDNNKVKLRRGYDKEIEGWQRTRKVVYDFVYGETNQALGMMLFRAIGFTESAGKLKREFYRMTEPEAWLFLKNSDRRANTILSKAEKRIYYRRMAFIEWECASDTVKAVCDDSSNRLVIADEISRRLNIPTEAVCVHAGKGVNKRQKDLSKMLEGVSVGSNGNGKNKRVVSVYIDPEYSNARSKVKDIIQDLVS